MRAVFHRQIKSLFHSWIFYGVCAVFLFALGILVTTFHGTYEYSNVEYLLFYLMIVLSLLLPLLTSFIFVEERKRSVERFLRALPISDREFVFGKYLALLAMLGGISFLLLLLPMFLGLWGSVHYASSYMAIFAFFLFGFAILSMNYFFALIAKNHWISLSLSYGVTAVLIALTYVAVALPSPLGALLERVSLFGAYAPFIYGITDLSVVGLYLSIGVLFLLLSAWSSSKLWKK